MKIGIRNDRVVILMNTIDIEYQGWQIVQYYKNPNLSITRVFPYIARMSRRIAQAYEDEAQRNDRDAEQRQGE